MPDDNTVPISELTADTKNANRGTVRGKKLLKNSLRKYGAGRSILLDKNNNIVAGNKTVAEAKRLGHKKVIVVDSDGETLVAVRRTDLDLNDKAAKELAISDNRVAELDLAWDPEVLSDTEADLTELFEPIELDNLTNDGKGRKRMDKIDLQPPPKMIWVLLGIPFNRFDAIQEPLAVLEAESEISVQQARNE